MVQDVDDPVQERNRNEIPKPERNEEETTEVRVVYQERVSIQEIAAAAHAERHQKPP